jgi:putative ABC transport system permease protein
MQFFLFIWHNLLRRPIRSGLTLAGLSIAVTFVIACVGVADNFPRQFQALYDRREVALVIQKVGSGAELNNSLPEQMMDEIRSLPHVSDVMGGLMDGVSLEEGSPVPVIINGWKADSPLFKDRTMLSGRTPTAADVHKVIIGRILAANLGKKVGDQLTIYGTPVEIIGVFDSHNVYEDGSIATLLSDMQDFMDRPQRVTGILVKSSIPRDGSIEHEGEMTELRQQIEALGKRHDEEVAAMPSNQFIENVGQIKLAKAVAWVISVIALAIGAIGMLNTMVMSVSERVREIGTLRAIGWRKLRVMRMIVWESLLLSIGGAIVGSIAAVLLTRFLSKMPMTSGLVGGEIAPVIFVEGFLLALLVGFAGALYPAYWGANLRPIEAMRRK